MTCTSCCCGPPCRPHRGVALRCRVASVNQGYIEDPVQQRLRRARCCRQKQCRARCYPPLVRDAHPLPMPILPLDPYPLARLQTGCPLPAPQTAAQYRATLVANNVCPQNIVSATCLPRGDESLYRARDAIVVTPPVGTCRACR